MIYVWQEKDVRCGIFVCRRPPEGEDLEPSGWNAKWMYKIGYQRSRSAGATLVCMADGMIGRKRTVKEMADYLNENDMIPMPHKWVIKMFEYMRDWYNYG